jgi:arginyl-tRNA synthetase
MELVPGIKLAVQTVLADKYDYRIETQDILVNETKPEFTGDYTVVLFSFSKTLKTNPDGLGRVLGDALLSSRPGWFSEFNVIKGFLNLVMSEGILVEFLNAQFNNPDYGIKKPHGRRVMVEYSSPNTNKPLHLGHLRNNFLGWSVAAIYKTSGYEIIKTCIANDRGIHICKSMVAWLQFGMGQTPESTGIKGDHFVGDHYVLFGNELKKQVEAGMASGLSKELAEKEAPLMKSAQQMLVDWEAGKPEVIELWKKMNSWVYAGFDITYKRIGSDFDRIYYESQTYLLGKDLVETGLKKKVFFQKEDGSVWIDLKPDGLDEKIVRRSDGTAVYITQDIGLAVDLEDQRHLAGVVRVVARGQADLAGERRVAGLGGEAELLAGRAALSILSRNTARRKVGWVFPLRQVTNLSRRPSPIFIGDLDSPGRLPVSSDRQAIDPEAGNVRPTQNCLRTYTRAVDPASDAAHAT